ncbi:MAG: ferritin-like domain-containing protein [Chitinophagaceae bacterium]
MSKSSTELNEAESSGSRFLSNVSRRKFLNYAGASAGAMLVASSCSKELRQNPQGDSHLNSEGGGIDGGKRNVNLGEGDIGILNYAYALEQLEAAFYTQVIATPYSGLAGKDLEYLTDIRDHEIAHREFFKNVLGDDRIGGLIVDFSTINFSSKDSVLATAKAFEDLGVSAYNGAGELLQSADYLLYAGKIVSVEARHAATLRDMISYGSFADSTAVNSMGLDLYRTPPEVLAIADQYILTNINSKNLPTS